MTFLLQKHKSEIPGFDSWYAGWQEKMRADSLMKWSVEARNRIVKQGDLKLHSLLRVSVVGSYLDSEVPYIQYEAAPKLDTEKILRDVHKLNIPPPVLKDAYLQIERRWVENDMPEHELLSALSHCWELLAKLLADAPHTGLEPKSSPHFADSLPACMIDSGDIRSLWVKLSTGKMVTLASQSMEVTRKTAQQSFARYFGDSTSVQRTDSPPSLKELSEMLFEQAKRVLQVDGYHILVVFLILPDHSARLIRLTPEDQSEKYLLWRSIGLEVKRCRAIALITISEVWTAPFDVQRPYVHAAEREDRGEALNLVALSKEGDEIVLVSPFHRDGDTITFEDTIIESSGTLNFLEPVRNAWKN